MFVLKAVLIIAGLQVWAGTRQDYSWDTLEQCRAEAPAILEADREKFAHFVAENVGEGVPFVVQAECVEKPKPEPKGQPVDFVPTFSITPQSLVMAVVKGPERKVYRFPQVYSATDDACDRARRELRRTAVPAPGVRLYLECVPALPEA